MKKYLIMLLILLFAKSAWAMDLPGISVVNGATDVITYFVLRDRAASTVDVGVVIANLEMYYIEDQVAESADAFVGAHGAVTDAHTDGECIHVGHGVYRVDWPDAAFDGGIGKKVKLIVVDGDAGAFTTTMEVLLSPPVNITSISDDSTAANNLELQYDGTGIIGDNFPFTQAEGAAVGGGLAINTTMASVTVILGSEQNLSNASTSDDSWWTGDDDGAGAEFIFRCTPSDTGGVPVEIMFEGYYDEPAGATNGATLQIYNFNTAGWDTIVTLSNSGADEDHEVPLSHAHRAPGTGTLETAGYTIGDAMIKFKQDAQETGNACLLIDHMVVGYVGGLSATAAAIVDEWESQAASDPTGFKVNVMEVNGTGQTANDNGADINTIVTAVGNIETDTSAYDTDAEYAEAIWGADVSTYADEDDFGGELGGLDPNLAFVLQDTGTTIPGTITTAQNDLDTITGTSGVLIGTDAMDRSGTLDVNTKTMSTGALSGAAVHADAATKIIDDFETQSQADPTGFHVNVMEADSNDLAVDNIKNFFGNVGAGDAYEQFEDTFDGTGYAGGTIEWAVDAIEISGDATAANNLEDFWDETNVTARMKEVWETDYATNYDTTANMWNVDVALIDGNDVTVDNLHEFFGKTSSVGAYENFEDMYDSTGYVGGTIKIETDVQEVDGVAAAATTMETFFDVSTAADNLHDFFSNATAYGHFDDTHDGTTVSIASTWSDALAASDITDDWESQSQSDPTGFHVNLLEINDTVTQLEMLMDLTTSINADADLTGIVVDKSVLSHMMTPAADTSTYNASEDSLEALGTDVDAVIAGVNVSSVDGNDLAADHLHHFFGNVGAGDPYEQFEDTFDGTGYAGGTIEWTVDAIEVSGDAVAANNMENFWDETNVTARMIEVWETDYGTNYDTTTNMWNVDVEAVDGDTTAATNMEVFWDVSTASVAFHDFWDETNAAANMKEIYITDHGTNYDGTTNRWDTDVALVDGNDVTADNLHEFFGKTNSVGAYGNFEDVYDGTGYIGGTEHLHVDVIEIESADATEANIGINWADVSNPTTTLGLTNTTVLKLVELDEDNTTIDLDSTAVGSVVGNYALDTTVNTVTSTTVFTLAAGVTNDNAFLYNIIAVKDNTDSHFEVRTVIIYTGATREVTLNRALTFTPVNGDVVHVIEGAYFLDTGGWW